MITLLVATALAATAPNGNTFDLPSGWSDGPVFRDDFGDEVVGHVDPRPCPLLFERHPLGPGQHPIGLWPTPPPWLGWDPNDGTYHACVAVPGGSLVVDIATNRHEVLFNRYLPLLAPLRAAMELEPVHTSGTPSSATSEDDATPIIGGMGLFATMGENAPAGGGFALHFSAPAQDTGPFVGLNFGLGAVGGFLYDVDFHLGFAWTAGVLHSALYSGVGADGVTSRVRGSAKAPLGAVVFAPILPRLTVELGGEGRWYSAGRRAYVDGFAGFDEVEAYTGLWFARQVDASSEDTPNGLWLGGSWKETPDGWVARITVGTGTVALR